MTNVLQQMHDEWVADYRKHGDTAKMGHITFCVYNDLSEEMTKKLWKGYKDKKD